MLRLLYRNLARAATMHPETLPPSTFLALFSSAGLPKRELLRSDISHELLRLAFSPAGSEALGASSLDAGFEALRFSNDRTAALHFPLVDRHSIPVFTLDAVHLPGEGVDYRFFEPRYLLAVNEVMSRGMRRFVYLSNSARQNIMSTGRGVGVTIYLQECTSDPSGENVFARCVVGPRVIATHPVLQEVENSHPLLRVDLMEEVGHASSEEEEALAELCRLRLGNYVENLDQPASSAADWLHITGVPPNDAIRFSYWLAGLMLRDEPASVRQDFLEDGAPDRLKKLHKILVALCGNEAAMREAPVVDVRATRS